MIESWQWIKENIGGVVAVLAIVTLALMAMGAL